MNTKKLLAAIIVMIIWQFFVYGCISFFYMEPNPKLWPWDGRFFQVGFGFILGLVLSGAAAALSEK